MHVAVRESACVNLGELEVFADRRIRYLHRTTYLSWTDPKTQG